MSEHEAPEAIHLSDYRPPDYTVDRIDLRFELGEQSTRVRARSRVRRQAAAEAVPLVLDGQELELLRVCVDGRERAPTDYHVEAGKLVIDEVPDAFELEVETRIRPQENTSLEGLYQSSGTFCTQCEAEGFRKITYFPDRPDVMAVYSTTIVADPGTCPVMLSNGNPVDSGELADGRHWIRWEDPFPKPSYLFALVAGDLGVVEDRFRTRSGREVKLQLFVEHHNLDKCDHAMASLKRAMRWDEEVYGREYDLDIYMVVAVDDFNMGAMENKGLNIFNSRFVLARPDTATDDDYENIESVIAHEYFHNWSGNRVTCRDWFQLSLKEGFTVFRDEQFTADMTSAAVKRIKDVSVLRNIQFPEDDGPMAHPVRPERYVEINNFYTPTVYNKGAEVVRMQHTLLGPERFRRGTDRFFERFDGQAVTVEDFVACMEEAGERDLGQFRRWYSQAGTPRLSVSDAFDPETGRYTLTVRQDCPPSPGQPEKAPFHVPLRMGLLDGDGRELPTRLAGEGEAVEGSRVLEVTEAEQSFVFEGLESRPLPSLLRGFSAPVKLDYAYTPADLAFLMAHDSDPFNQWDAGQRLASRVLMEGVDAVGKGEEPPVDPAFTEAFGKLLEQTDDPSLVAEALRLPSENVLAEQMERIDVDGIHAARRGVRRALAEVHQSRLLALYRGLGDGSIAGGAPAAARRKLRNVCLDYLMSLEDPVVIALCDEQFAGAENMTDSIAALRLLAHTPCDEGPEALEAFRRRWQNDPLVMDKWLAVQATSPLEDARQRVRELLDHPAFDIRNPNRVRALVGSFARGNPVHFHAADGEGYALVADQVLRLDALNPQVAARLAGAFNQYRRLDEGRMGAAREQLERIAATPQLSRDVREVVSRALEQ